MNKITESEDRELSYFELYLLSFLKENHPERVNDKSFITERANECSEIYEQSRREGYPVEGAQEIAMAHLTEGLNFSGYSFFKNIILEEFSNKIQETKVLELYIRLSSALEEIFNKYNLSDESSTSLDDDRLYSELTGLISIYLSENVI